MPPDVLASTRNSIAPRVPNVNVADVPLADVANAALFLRSGDKLALVASLGKALNSSNAVATSCKLVSVDDRFLSKFVVSGNQPC